MTGQDELLSAAAAVSAASLEQAAAAVAEGCRELSRWAGLFSCRLEGLAPGEEHKFARAFSLTMLGHLPARPATCPFCIQYGQNRACTGCGYAATHGRCDDDASSFSVFIEAFQELGRVIYQDTEGQPMQREEAIAALSRSISSAQERAGRMEAEAEVLGRQGGEPGHGTMRLMVLKKEYLAEMIGLIAFELLCSEVEAQARRVEEALERYW
ncbi:MAG TPA: hypothetical protein PKK11_08915 [Methanothrix sp.]|nr:hypothetical protein [Methanothrix sp.]HPT20062.1 hypothetical protein [Methanothrix sp.]